MKRSPVFKAISALQGDAPWGHVLDAGTGTKSLRWVSSLPSERWTAVTAQKSFAANIQQTLQLPARDTDRVMVGNWANPEFLANENFDTVILDYLIGATDAFAPYFQSTLVDRLAACTQHCMYIVGLEPYVPVIANDEIGLFIGDLGRLRDACMLLSRDRPYREYPAAWVDTQLDRVGFQVTDAKFFKIRYRSSFVASQLAICRARADRLDDPKLANALQSHIAEMEQRGESLITKHDGLPYGRDYVLRAVRRR